MNNKSKLRILHYLSSSFFGIAWLYYRGGALFQSDFIEESAKIIGLLIIGYIITGVFSYLATYFSLKYFSHYNQNKHDINFDSGEAIYFLSTAYITIILFCLLILLTEAGFFEGFEDVY